MRAAAILLAAALTTLSGCATMQSTDTFAVCKTADVVTTGIAMSSGGFVEANPLMRPLVSNGILPFAALSFGIYKLIEYINRPEVTLGANAVTCPVAAHNALLLIR